MTRMGKWKLFFPGPPCLIIHLSFFHLVNYVCHMSVVLWYLLIGLLVNVSSGITGTDMDSITGQMKDDPDHGFRVCVNALINKCLKPYAGTIPLATDEIKKLH